MLLPAYNVLTLFRSLVIGYFLEYFRQKIHLALSVRKSFNHYHTRLEVVLIECGKCV